MKRQVFPLVSRAVLVAAAPFVALGCQGPRIDSSGAAVHGQGLPLQGWLSWRGPLQTGASLEQDLPEQVAPESDSETWTHELAGRGTPVIGGGRVYALGYAGEGEELQEILVCLEESTGKKLWEHHFTDFLTDIIYYRFSIGSPTIDPATGKVFCWSTAGLLNCFTADGQLVWQHSMSSEYGRLTFPNGRTGAPLVDGDLVIVHTPTAGWGPHAPARDRFYAFDKNSGEPIWSSTPGGPPKDASFSFPVLATENGRRVLYAGLAGGHVVCVDVRTGDPLWRYQIAIGGVSTSPVLHGDSVIAIHGKENLDSSTIGRMVAIKRGARPAVGASPAVLTKNHERWRNRLTGFSSSPVLVGNRVYQTVMTGELQCVSAESGEVLWHEKLAPDQIHASPAAGDGKLYVPMNNGSFHIIRPTNEGPEILQQVQLEGNCLAAPAIANGRIYVHTTSKLYCFGKGALAVVPPAPRPPAMPVGAATRLQVVPGDTVVVVGDEIPFRARSLDANGQVVAKAVASVGWSGLPAGATIRDGKLRVASGAQPATSLLKASAGGLVGTARLRIVAQLPYSEDFDSFPVKPHPKEPSVEVGPSPSYWVNAGRKWEVRKLDGNKVLARTLDNPIFQRTISLIGHPRMSNYTVQADLLADGNRRSMSSVGVVNQRYQIVLLGNYQEIEISSNMELLRRTVSFPWQRGIWYRMKTRVDVGDDGSGWIRAKVWQRDQPEPDAWTIEVEHSHAHTNGSPGLYGFTPQSRFRAYIDNVSVTPND